MNRFKLFVINEEKSFLGHKVGDILTSVQDLQSDMENLGTRHLSRFAEEIVNQIRKILHDNWSPKTQKHLKDLQRIAVALQKTIDDKGDVREILPAIVKSLEDLSGKIGVKINNLKAPEMPGEDVNQADFQLTGNGPAPKQPANPQAAETGQV